MPEHIVVTNGQLLLVVAMGFGGCGIPRVAALVLGVANPGPLQSISRERMPDAAAEQERFVGSVPGREAPQSTLVPGWLLQEDHDGQHDAGDAYGDRRAEYRVTSVPRVAVTVVRTEPTTTPIATAKAEGPSQPATQPVGAGEEAQHPAAAEQQRPGSAKVPVTPPMIIS